MIRLSRADFGFFMVENLDADPELPRDDPRASLLVQSDWDYPGIAGTFEWSAAWVGTLACESCDAPTGAIIAEGGSIPDVPICRACADTAPDPAYLASVRRFACGHSETDGTIACADCGLTATDFIGAAADWLADHIGATADDPGYFRRN